MPALEGVTFGGGLKSKHRDRLDRQARDEAVLVLAEVDGEIVGHLLLKWGGPSEPALVSVLPPCAEVEDFVIHESYRGQGIGSRMLDHADDRCCERGVQHIGLGVGDANPSARAIYRHKGFRTVPGSGFTVTWPYLDANGLQQTGSEACTYMLKEIA